MTNQFKYDPSAINEAKINVNNALSCIEKMNSTIIEINNIAASVKVTTNLSSITSKLSSETSRILNIPSAINVWEASIFKSLIQSGQFESTLSDWISSGKIVCSDLVEISSNYIQALISVYGNDYWKHLKKIKVPLEALREAGMPEEFIEQINQSFCEKLIEKNLMYTGDGVAYMSYSFTGLLAMFGLCLDYRRGGSYDKASSSGFYLGDSGNALKTLDCNNYFDWICRCVGVDSHAYRACEKHLYGIDDVTDHSEINAAYGSDYFVKGKSGDILSNSGHMVVILENTGEGYWITEEYDCAQIKYLSYEEVGKKYCITNMSALYRNTNKNNNANRYDANNLIPPSTFKEYFPNIFDELIQQLEGQYNKRNLYGLSAEEIKAIISGENIAVNISNNINNSSLSSIIKNIDNINFDNMWNNDIMINVVSADGEKTPIGSYSLDEYVAGVISGESVMRMYYMDNYRKGKCTYEEMLAAAMSFAVVARSYAVVQTVESSRHSEDHEIEAGVSKQCFSASRLEGKYSGFADPNCGIEMAKIAKLAAYLTSGQVLVDSNGNVANAHYRSSTQHALIDTAVANREVNYNELLKTVYSTGYNNEYPDGLVLSNYDYSTESVVGGKVSINVPNNGSLNQTSDVVQINTSPMEKTSNVNISITSPNRTPDVNQINLSTESSFVSAINNNKNVLPTDKFSIQLPKLNSGELGMMEINNEHVTYEILNVNDNVYNDYLASMKAFGYTLNENGTAWLKDNYELNISYDGDNCMQIMLKQIIDKYFV